VTTPANHARYRTASRPGGVAASAIVAGFLGAACTSTGSGAGSETKNVPGVEMTATKDVDELFSSYLTGIASSERPLTTEAVEASQRARAALLDIGAPAAVPLAHRWAAPSFAEKDATWDLILELGHSVVPELRERADELPAVARVWAASARHYFGDPSAVDDLGRLLASETRYVRHLAALALAFQGEVPSPIARTMLEVLIDALRSDEMLEGTKFSVAGAALACLVALTEQPLVPPGKTIVFYNYNEYAFPPPVHPFPFPSDYMVAASAEERAAVVAAAEDWWTKAAEGTLSLRSIEPQWPRAEPMALAPGT
jgi:hypothetical protein